MRAKINDNFFDLKTVFLDKDIQNGMMKKKFDGSYNGMLFLMNNLSHSFWMKNCIVHLDIIHIKNKKILKIHHNCKPCFTNECDSFEGEGDMVLELPGNTCKEYNIKEGDILQLS